MSPASCSRALLALLLACPLAAQITTSQYDNARSGTNPNEKILTPKNVNSRQFGKLGAFQVDGAVYAQPLYVPNLEIPGKGKHNVLYVATEHDSVYAFDADKPGSAPLWHVNFLDDARGVVPLSAGVVQCPFIRPEVGITPTPVIDMRTGTLYVLARTMIRHPVAANEYMQDLHALAITTGVEKFGGPKRIAATVAGKGDGAAGGRLAFDPLRENPRASLLLVNGTVILTWASSCDVDPYHGWVMSYDAQTLQQKAVFNDTPDGSEGGIWASDTGPAADDEGNIYVPTGNGTFNAARGGRDYGDTVLKLDAATLAIRDYFTPSDQEQLSAADADLGSSGPTLLPDQKGTHPHLLLQPTKNGTLYVLDRDKLGRFRANGDDVVQKLKMEGEGAYGAMAFWNGHAYFVTSDDYLREYSLVGGVLKQTGRALSPKFANPGATPAVSSDGSKNGIVWVIATKTWDGEDHSAVLYAYDAANLAQPIYTSQANPNDRAGLATRFVVPLVVNGRVYFGSRGEVDVYGLR